jgi:integrase/recombinase XerD
MAGRPRGTALNGRIRYFTDGELEAFMKAARRHGAKWAALWGLTYHFALRVGEAVSLRLADFDMNAHQVRIKAEKGGLTRVYDMPEKLERSLKAWLRERAALEWAGENPYLFPSRELPRTEHMTSESAWKLFQLTCRRAGLANPHSPHDLRHTCASQMAAKGDSLVQIARWLRHKNVASSERYLSDMNSAEHEREMERRSAKFL